MIGSSLLHYEIKEKIGKGGMGEVFCARDTKLGRDVAIKVLPKELSGDPEREARFQREARALASLQHTNVASVYGFEEADGVRFMVMELISGVELSQRMKAGPIPVDEALNIARQVAAGLDDQQLFGIRFDLAFPAVNRLHASRPVHAGREPALDEGAGDPLPRAVRRRRSEKNDE